MRRGADQCRVTADIGSLSRLWPPRVVEMTQERLMHCAAQQSEEVDFGSLSGHGL
jgi:hypothetical protein